jgi:aldose 1-epimerase
VDGSVFDFRRNAHLGERLGSPARQLQLAGGFDHFFLLDGVPGRSDFAASVYSPESGIRMKLHTDQPGVQFYSGNWLGDPFGPRAGLCLEFQDIPNEPNMKGFPSTLLRPGQTYRRHITLAFECGDNRV